MPFKKAFPIRCPYYLFPTNPLIIFMKPPLLSQSKTPTTRKNSQSTSLKVLLHQRIICQTIALWLAIGQIGTVLAQAPIISYPGPQSYQVNKLISPLKPVSSGSAVSGIYGRSLSFVGDLNGGPGSVDGFGTTARFKLPRGVAIDKLGNIYIADSGNHKIRKITPAGEVSTFAGSGTIGSADGKGTAASFFVPHDLVFDASGNLYVADARNHKIRKITPSGKVTTFAGSGQEGAVDGIGTSASFKQPVGLAIDAMGNIYVGDSRNHKIRKISPIGVVSTLAGSGAWGSEDGIGTTAKFNYPGFLAVDSEGNVFVTDNLKYSIRKISPAGVVTTFAGSGIAGSVDGNGVEASFQAPDGLAMDIAGYLYVTDGPKIRKISPGGVVSTIAGGNDYGVRDGIGTDAKFYKPSDLAFDAIGNIYITDDHRVRKITPARVVSSLAGSDSPGSTDGTGAAASFLNPFGVALDASGNIYVADSRNFKIRKVTSTGIVTSFAGSGFSGAVDGLGTAASFNNPTGVVVHASGVIYVADAENHKIRKISPSGVVTTFAGSGTIGSEDGIGIAASFNRPHGIAVDAIGNLYVADSDNHKIRKINPEGVVSTLAGTGISGSTDGPGLEASFFSPYGVAADAYGNVYVADTKNRKIRKISSAGEVSTIAGTGYWGGGGLDGPGTVATFDFPYSVAVDFSNHVYVADFGHFKVRKISPSGVVTTLAGGVAGSKNGIGSDASFFTPAGVSLDASGTVFVTEISYHRIRKIEQGFSVSPVLPEGLTLGPDGAISGTPKSPSPATTYTVTAVNGFGSATATVSIEITNVVACTDVLDNAYEPNNKQSNASSIGLNEKVVANLSSATDIDWFKLTIPTSGTYTIYLSPNDAVGSEIINASPKNGVISVSGISQSNKSRIITANLSAGTIFIKISDSGLTTRYCYTLSMVAGLPSGIASNAGARENVEIEPVLHQINLEAIVTPNPVRDQLKVVVTGAGSQNAVRVQLLSLDQREMGTYLVPVLEGHAEQIIDVKSLPEGIYILTVAGENGSISRKVLKIN
jgi:sugar lactone lactonase YvrE